MMHTDYLRALAKIRTKPLELTEADFSALEEFNPADEQRARERVRQAQLARMATHTKAAPDQDQATMLADALERAVRAALAPVVARVRALETATAELGPLRARLAALEAEPFEEPT